MTTPCCVRCERHELHGVPCVVPVAGGLDDDGVPRGDKWHCVACGHEWPMMTEAAAEEGQSLQ